MVIVTQASTLAALPQQTATQQARYHRARWVLSTLYVLLARASEFAQERMCDLYQVRRPHAEQAHGRLDGLVNNAAISDPGDSRPCQR
ncbi:hypothetical protein CKO15_09515 [Halorhodospira abdelmalekii]|uniref:hypothetical protein n=1 Tax=Halorhodospira abdelmalekii TaxID=421629 RepID=UPI0019056706|nr:hypothetical protein [Halorhodospira abdelmalekii]MBK1735517.1 hypothetical protein [Halorhodospira abdelmalekii]